MLRPWTRLLKNPRYRADASGDDSEDVQETFVTEFKSVGAPARMTERRES